MNLFIILVCLLAQTSSIDLNLPLGFHDLSVFCVHYIESEESYAEKILGVIYKYKSIMAVNNEITRVLYNGHLLYRDREEHTGTPNRVVQYNEMKGRVFISIRKGGLPSYDAYFYIANDTVYNLLELNKLINQSDGRIDLLTPGMFISNNYDTISDRSGRFGIYGIAKRHIRISSGNVYVTSLTARHDIDKIFEKDILHLENPYDPVYDREYLTNVFENE